MMRVPFAGSLRAVNSRCGAQLCRVYYSTDKKKDRLNLNFGPEFFGKTKKKEETQRIPEPESNARKLKAEEALGRLWKTNKTIITGENSENFSIKAPAEYRDFLFPNSDVESDIEIANEFKDPYDFQAYSLDNLTEDSAEDEIPGQNKNQSLDNEEAPEKDVLSALFDSAKKSKVEESVVEKEKEEEESDDFDAVMNQSKSQFPEPGEAKPGEVYTPVNVEGEADPGAPVTPPSAPRNLQGGIEKQYTIDDLLRSDQVAPRVPELDGVEDEYNQQKDANEEDMTFIEDLDLSRYELQKGNFIEAQQFLQDVSKFQTRDFPFEKREKVVEMVKRARRILDSQKESKSFWDEFIVLRQLNEFALMAPIHYRPVLNPAVKDSMFLLHQSNPEEWTTGKLAQRFRVKKARVEAILLLKIQEHILRKTAPWSVNLDGDNIDYMYAEFFGMSECGDWVGFEDDRFDITERRWRNARISYIDDEQEDLASLARMAVRIKPAWFEMPEARPTGPDAYPFVYPDGQQIRGPLHKRWAQSSGSAGSRLKRSENIFIDSSPVDNFEEECKMFWYKPDGSMRHVTWEERRRVFRKHRFSDSLKARSFINQETLTDPVIFPTDAEEERLLEAQKHPLMRNRRFATQKVFTENDMLREMDKDYQRIGNLLLPAEHYVRGRMPWSVQEMLKKERATNVLDTIYKPLHDNWK